MIIPILHFTLIIQPALVIESDSIVFILLVTYYECNRILPQNEIYQLLTLIKDVMVTLDLETC